MKTKLSQEQIDLIEEKEKLVSEWFTNTLPDLQYKEPSPIATHAIHSEYRKLIRILNQAGLEEPEYCFGSDPYCSYSGRKLRTLPEYIVGIHPDVASKFKLPYSINEMAVIILESDLLTHSVYDLSHFFFICYENNYDLQLVFRLASILEAKQEAIWDICEVIRAEIAESSKPKPV